ncbi:MAG: flagellar hook-basal body complex protein FliE [Oscillospiraceae bacterium]|nr:flagellar hook-basal body complex protein FliE [Oscillospiraceae bacterium]
MFIVPINSSMRPIESLFEDNNAAGIQDQDKPQFSDVFKEIFSEVQDTQRVVQEDSLRLAMGEIDDLHTIYNNMTKASVAVDTFVAVKDAVVNAYDRIIQMSM